MYFIWHTSVTTLVLLFLTSVYSFQVPHTRQKSTLLRATGDGWNDDISENKLEENMQLLKSLQQEKPPTERDMFIPIFTLVSIAGFTGAYGYEMLRLYSRGELYLPF